MLTKFRSIFLWNEIKGEVISEGIFNLIPSSCSHLVQLRDSDLVRVLGERVQIETNIVWDNSTFKDTILDLAKL